MDKQEETLATWNKVAKLYEEKFMDIDLYNDSYDLFCTALQNENVTVLDVACGPGSITKYLQHKIPSLQIDAIDFSPNMIVLAKANNPSAKCFVMDCREINKLQQQYDGIINGFGLPYLSNKECEKFIEYAAGLLRNSGVLYMSFVEGNYLDSGFKASSIGDRTYFYYHSTKHIIDTLEKHKFEILQTINKIYNNGISKPEDHTIIMARKTLQEQPIV